MKGLIAYSFALSENEPNLCNHNIAKEVERIMENEQERIVVVAQWEVAKALTGLGILPDLVVEKHRKERAYLDNKEVTEQAAEFFRKVGIKEVIPVAQPFLQLRKCIYLINKIGLAPIRRKIGQIGFYKKSIQWWTRGPTRLLIYGVLQLFFGRHGQRIRP